MPAPPNRPRNRWLFAAQLIVAAAVIAFIGKTLYRQWADYRAQPLEVHPRWALIALSGVIVLATYALLIETWRALLAGWNARLPYAVASRIWFVSNLGKYVPGKVAQIGTMAVMANQAGVSPIAASASALINALVNVSVGIAVAVVTGWSAIGALSRGHASLGIVVVVIVIGGLLLLPLVTPQLLSVAARITGRELGVTALPRRAIFVAIIGNVVAWLAYGAAFQLLVAGVIGHAGGNPADYIAAYASSYVLGYLALFAPGGIGVRDVSIAASLPALGLATPPQAAVIMVSSRLWLTVLELVPGFVFLARRTSPPPRPHEARLKNGST